MPPPSSTLTLPIQPTPRRRRVLSSPSPPPSAACVVPPCARRWKDTDDVIVADARWRTGSLARATVRAKPGPPLPALVAAGGRSGTYGAARAGGGWGQSISHLPLNPHLASAFKSVVTSPAFFAPLSASPSYAPPQPPSPHHRAASAFAAVLPPPQSPPSRRARPTYILGSSRLRFRLCLILLRSLNDLALKLVRPSLLLGCSRNSHTSVVTSKPIFSIIDDYGS